MKRPAGQAAQVDEKNDDAAKAGKGIKDHNPFELPPPEGQKSLGQYFHIEPAASTDADAADTDKDKEQTKQEVEGTDRQSSSSSSSSSSTSELDAKLTFHSLDDDFDIPSPSQDTVPQEVEATYIATDGATDSVRSFDSMFRFAQRHVDRVERFLTY